MTWTALPVLVHPPIEWLGYAYFGSLEPAVDVGTLLPGPLEGEPHLATPFLRMEAGGGDPALEIMFDLDLILHAYHGTNEDGAKALSSRATALGAGLRNAVLAVPLVEDGPVYDWTVHRSRVSAAPHRQIDPMVNLPRYRSMVTWTVVGRAL